MKALQIIIAAGACTLLASGSVALAANPNTLGTPELKLPKIATAAPRTTDEKANLTGMVFPGGSSYAPGNVAMNSDISFSKANNNCLLDFSALTVNEGAQAPIQVFKKDGGVGVKTNLSTNFNLGMLNLPTPGKYRFIAKARATADNTCAGDARFDFEVKRAKLSFAEPAAKPSAKPVIEGIIVKSKSTGSQDFARPDDGLLLAVQGNVSNSNDKSLQCGWTLLLIDANGVGKPIAKGSKFGYTSHIASGALSGFAAGTYTLRAKSTSFNDDQAAQGCASSADIPFTLLPQVGNIAGAKQKP